MAIDSARAAAVRTYLADCGHAISDEGGWTHDEMATR